VRGCVLHRYILFQTQKETVFLIKRHQESQFPSRDIRKSDIEEKRERTRVSEYVSEKEGGREKEGPEGSSAMHPLAQLSGEKRGTSKNWVIRRSPVRFRPKPRQLKSIWI